MRNLTAIAAIASASISFSAHAQFDLSKSLSGLLQKAITATTQEAPATRTELVKVDQAKLDQIEAGLTQADKDFLEGLRQAREVGMVSFDALRIGGRFYEYRALDQQKTLSRYGCDQKPNEYRDRTDPPVQTVTYAGESSLLTGATLKKCRTTYTTTVFDDVGRDLTINTIVNLMQPTPEAEAYLLTKGLIDAPAPLGRAKPTEFIVWGLIHHISRRSANPVDDYVQILKQRNPRLSVVVREQETDVDEQFIKFMSAEGFNVAGLGSMVDPATKYVQARIAGANIDAMLNEKDQTCGKYSRGQTLAQYLKAGGWASNPSCEDHYRASKFMEATIRFRATVKPNPKGEVKRESYGFDGHLQPDGSAKPGVKLKADNAIIVDYSGGALSVMTYTYAANAANLMKAGTEAAKKAADEEARTKAQKNAERAL